ncbi:hypothetical protein CR513_49910, partial [Mucuna pruriens]
MGSHQSADDYYDWELKVKQNLDCFNCEDLVKVKLIAFYKKIYQSSRCIEEYSKEKEVTLVIAQIVETQETIMTRFLHGLNRDIQDIMELHDYTSISTLVHQASKVESQLRMHGNKSYPTTSSN